MIKLFTSDERKGYQRALMDAISYATKPWLFIVDSDYQFAAIDFWRSEARRFSTCQNCFVICFAQFLGILRMAIEFEERHLMPTRTSGYWLFPLRRFWHWCHKPLRTR